MPSFSRLSTFCWNSPNFSRRGWSRVGQVSPILLVEALPVKLEDFIGEGFELIGQLLTGVLDDCDLLFGRVLFRFEGLPQFGGFDLGRVGIPAALFCLSGRAIERCFQLPRFAG